MLIGAPLALEQRGLQTGCVWCTEKHADCPTCPKISSNGCTEISNCAGIMQCQFIDIAVGQAGDAQDNGVHWVLACVVVDC